MSPAAADSCILLLGPPGSGKSAVLQRVLAALPRRRFAGFFVRALRGGRIPPTPAATMPGQREVAERHLVVLDGRTRRIVPRPLARRIPGSDVEAFDPTAVREDALPALRGARGGTDLVVLDEVDRIAAAAPELRDAVEAAFAGETPLLLTARALTPPWLAELAEREGATVVRVHRANRAGLEHRVARRIRAASGEASPAGERS